MSHSIKVTDTTYQELMGRLRTRETFDHLVQRLLWAVELLEKAIPLIYEKRRELLESSAELDIMTRARANRVETPEEIKP